MAAALASLAAVTALSATPSAAELGLRPAFPRPAAASPAPAMTPPRDRRIARAATSQARKEQLLELWVNGRTRNVVARVMEERGQIFVANAQLAAAGLRPPGGADAMTALSTLGATDVQILKSTQQLMITVPSEPQVFDVRRASSTLGPVSGAGFILSYDISAVFGEGARASSVGAALGASLFTPKGRLDATGLVMADKNSRRATRLETAIELNDAARMRRVTIGDSLTSQLPWSRSFRFAGVQLARDFSLQPDLVTLPALDFLGQASAPSTVDVFVNAARVYTGEVDPGPFELRNIPVVTGLGEAVVELRDAFGRTVSTVVPLYASSALLARGFTDYSFELGVMRRRYGLDDFAYGAPFASLSLRRGLTDRLTGEGHFEASPRVTVIGGGATFNLGPFGVGAASLAVSGREAGQGVLYAVSLERDWKRLRLYAAALGTSGPYGDVVAVHEGLATPSSRLQLGGSLQVGRRGTLAGSWIRERGDQRRVSLAAASYAYSLPGGWYFGASGVYDAETAAWASQLFLRLPLGRATSASVSAELSEARRASHYTLSRPANPDGGLGYRLSASPDDQRLQAEAIWYGSRANGSAEVSSDRGNFAARLQAAGAVVGMDGAAFAARDGGGAFALVKTGRPGVQVYRENRPVAVTDDKGRALVSGLTPNAPNRVGVEGADFPLSADVEAWDRAFAPARRSGVVLDFTPPPTRPALLVIRLASGAFPPAGSVLSLDSGERLAVGHRGQAFIRDLSVPTGGSVRDGETVCRIAVSPPPATADGGIPRLEAACAADRP